MISQIPYFVTLITVYVTGSQLCFYHSYHCRNTNSVTTSIVYIKGQVNCLDFVTVITVGTQIP